MWDKCKAEETHKKTESWKYSAWTTQNITFEADLHLESDKAEKSKPSDGEMRTDNPWRKNVVNWLDSTPNSEPNVNPWQHLEIMTSAKVFWW